MFLWCIYITGALYTLFCAWMHAHTLLFISQLKVWGWAGECVCFTLSVLPGWLLLLPNLPSLTFMFPQMPANSSRLTLIHSQQPFCFWLYSEATRDLMQVFDLPQVRQMGGSGGDGEWAGRGFVWSFMQASFNFDCLSHFHLHNHGCNTPAHRQLWGDSSSLCLTARWQPLRATDLRQPLSEGSALHVKALWARQSF